MKTCHMSTLLQPHRLLNKNTQLPPKQAEDPDRIIFLQAPKRVLGFLREGFGFTDRLEEGAVGPG